MKSDKKEVEKVVTVWDNKSVVCQRCKYQSNNPSFCSYYHKSVGRKQDASSCDKFKC